MSLKKGSSLVYIPTIVCSVFCFLLYNFFLDFGWLLEMHYLIFVLIKIKLTWPKPESYPSGPVFKNSLKNQLLSKECLIRLYNACSSWNTFLLVLTRMLNTSSAFCTKWLIRFWRQKTRNSNCRYSLQCFLAPHSSKLHSLLLKLYSVQRYLGSTFS